MLRKVYLTGQAGEKFGEVHEFKASSLVQVFNYFKTMIPGFREYMIEVPQFAFAKLKGDVAEVINSIGEKFGEFTEIFVMPVIEGAVDFGIAETAAIIAAAAMSAGSWIAANAVLVEILLMVAS